METSGSTNVVFSLKGQTYLVTCKTETKIGRTRHRRTISDLGGVVTAVFVLGSIHTRPSLVPGSKIILMKIAVYKIAPTCSIFNPHSNLIQTHSIQAKYLP